MKKVLSLLLVVVMICSLSVSVFATTDYTNGTNVSYVGDNTSFDENGDPVYAEAYTVTVPATMAPGGSAYVKAEGTWASNRQLVVDADDTVTLTNSINAADTKTLTVTFAGITLPGDNNAAVANYDAENEGQAISVSDIENALFGTWSGTFNYTVGIVDAE